MLISVASTYGASSGSLRRSEYAQTVERLFAGAEPKEIVATLPREPRKLFNQAFLDAFDRDQPHWYLDSFAANSLVDVTPRAPVRLYYGSKDLDVVPEEALNAARAMRARQADVSAVNVGEVGHDPSMLAAAPLILAWLGELDAEAQP